MHAAGRNQSHDVNRTFGLPGLVDQCQQDRPARKTAILDGQVDARQVLGDHPSGADIHVTHFGIAHLALGQAHRIARGFQQGMRPFLEQPGVIGRGGRGDGIVFGVIGPVAPAVENTKQGGTRRHEEILIEAGSKIGTRRQPVYRNAGPEAHITRDLRMPD